MLAPNESIETINKRLKDLHGYFSTTAYPMYRVVFSDEQFEKRRTQFTPEGLKLQFPIVAERPKYRHYLPSCYVLERVVEVPPFAETDLVSKWSYEPIWAFLTSDGKPLPPLWRAIELIIKSLLDASAKTVGAKYKDPRSGIKTKKDWDDFDHTQINKMCEELFGNESEIGDALHYKEAIIVPSKQLEGTVINATPKMDT